MLAQQNSLFLDEQNDIEIVTLIVSSLSFSDYFLSSYSVIWPSISRKIE